MKLLHVADIIARYFGNYALTKMSYLSALLVFC